MFSQNNPNLAPTTAEDVANWMFEKFQSTKHLYQEVIVNEIRKTFGTDFVYINANGNYAISKAVLKHFRKLSEGVAVWERSERAWRHLRENEKYKGRQVD